jgi:membrane protease YdiL (CAAX protease family)
MLPLIYSALNALLWLAVGASAVGWILLVGKQLGKRPGAILESIVPVRTRERPFWTPFELLVLIGIFLIITQLMLLWMVSLGWMTIPRGDDPPTSPLTTTGQLAPILVTSTAGIGATALVVLWLRLFDRDAVKKLGLTFRASDLWLGLKASLMILPPVMLIAAAVSRFVPYEHDVLKSLTQISEPVVFIATLAGTALVAPLFEEFMFRVVLQGGLQAWADRPAADAELQWRPRAYWPIVVSSLLFAAVHIGGQGAAAIPLFVLALGLGYLYRQTGCIAAPLVVHMVLNGLTLGVEMLKLHAT